MTSDLRHIPFRRVGASEVQLRYLEDDPEIRQCLGQRPRDVDDLLRRAPLAARRLVDRRELSDVLVAYAERHGAPAATIENARAVAEDDTYMIVTGQQPGLLGGPLYSLHKAATAVRLARDLSARPGAPRVVPIFWIHTDDHDIDEVNRAFMVNANHDVQKLRLDLGPSSAEPIRNIHVGRELEAAITAATGMLPDSDFRERVMGLFKARHGDEHLGDGFARMLFDLFGEQGILAIEPRDLPASAFDVLPRWCEQTDAIRDRTREITEHLTDIGLDVTMDPTTTLMFQVAGGVRTPLSDSEPFRRPTDLSPGVLLRPLWQDACLPTIGFVVGPGELSYLAIAGPLYKLLGVPQPLFVPRATLTLVEPSVAKILDRFGLDLTDLDRDPGEIAQALDAGTEGTIEEAIGELATQVASEFRSLQAQMQQTDAQMVGAMERTGGKVQDELEKLGARLRKARQARAGTGQRQVRKIVANLRPRGRLQERVLSPLPFMARHGSELGERLVQAADPFASGHGMLSL